MPVATLNVWIKEDLYPVFLKNRDDIRAKIKVLLAKELNKKV